MLSGEFASVPISSITIDREGRQRRELTGIEELAFSMKERGLIHPPVVTRELTLVAGERRIAAATQLGWDSITGQWADTLDQIELTALELEENVKRVDLTWQDQVSAVAAYDTLQRQRFSNWTLDKTAEALGISKTKLVQDIAVAREMKVNPKVAQASALSAARNLVQRTNERRAAAEKSAFTEVAKIERPNLIETADFTLWCQDYTGPKFNFLHCDFPYGVNMHKTSQGTHHEIMETYDDSEDVYFYLLGHFVDFINNFCDESAHVMFWFSMKFYGQTLSCLEAAGFNVIPHPLIWTKSDNAGIISDANRRPRHIYETALLGSRGDRKLVRPKSDSFAHPTVADTFHISNKPAPVLRYFFEMLVDDTTVMLDPTAGSGSAIRVARTLGARYVHGLELNPEIAAAANEEVNK